MSYHNHDPQDPTIPKRSVQKSEKPYAKGHTVDAELRKLEDICSTLDKALSDAMQLENRSPELERMIVVAHHEAHWMAAAEDEYRNSFV